jgi:hypothetical protein
VTDGKFATFVGSYDAGPLGVLVVKQEGDKLFATPPTGERVELVPQTTADSFVPQPVGGSAKFERNGAGKVIGLTVVLPNGREVKAKKT